MNKIIEKNLIMMCSDLEMDFGRGSVWHQIRLLISFFKFFFITIMLVLTLGVNADSQKTKKVLYGDLTETYATEIPYSGNFVVGIWLGELENRLFPEEMRVMMPRRKKKSNICFDASTRDGIYSVEGVLSAPPGDAEPLEVNFFNEKKFLPQLREYGVSDFGGLATLNKDCSRKSGTVLLPIMASDTSDKMTVLVNSRDSKLLTIFIDDTKYDGLKICKTDKEKRNSGFDTLCSIDLTTVKKHANMRHNLSIERKPRAGPIRIDDFVVFF